MGRAWNRRRTGRLQSIDATYHHNKCKYVDRNTKDERDFFGPRRAQQTVVKNYLGDPASPHSARYLTQLLPDLVAEPDFCWLETLALWPDHGEIKCFV